ncbi:right-handed parallel beta-helix repeat-containing protein [Salinigranum rubrum]|uniref:Right-handed parallel beta-helix repeat-containing protein n=1 Tax=Salinigranum rubrum TaxID=755307 RepID=A0A2I8VIZ2_9EURY|nr:right-handed parallel beta-helix repeat-containing protein [Salinigranum rubrum]
MDTSVVHGGLGAAAGFGWFGGAAQVSPPPVLSGGGSVYFVLKRAGGGSAATQSQGNSTAAEGRGVAGDTYVVVDAGAGEVAFSTDGTADEAFQYAFDDLTGGGTVVAGASTFQFGAPATMGSDTTLTGVGGTRFVASQTGTVETVLPTEEQDARVPAGHDIVRLRGDNVAVTNVEFDAGGTQRGNQAVQADGCRGVLIANNRTVNGFQMALSVTRCTNVSVVGNEVVDPNWYGITTRGAPAGSDKDLRQSRNVVIARNRVSGMKFNNIAPYNTNGFLVTGNVVFDGGHSLIACSPSQKGAIVGNVCRNLDEFAPDPGGEAGIELEYKETHLRDEVKGTQEALTYDVTVSGNQVDNCPVGVLVRTVPADEGNQGARETKRPFGFSVTGNTVSETGTGILVRSGADGVVATNTLRDNGTHVEEDDDYTTDIERGLNVTR